MDKFLLYHTSLNLSVFVLFCFCFLFFLIISLCELFHTRCSKKYPGTNTIQSFIQICFPVFPGKRYQSHFRSKLEQISYEVNQGFASKSYPCIFFLLILSRNDSTETFWQKHLPETFDRFGRKVYLDYCPT